MRRPMKTQTRNGYGFTLMELMVSMALGLIVMAAMASLFRTGLNSAMLVTQRAETQQNMRAAMDLMVKDVSMAGAGLPTGGVQLPNGTGWNGLSKYACDAGGTCHIPTYTYPNGNYMYGIIPGYSNGVEGGASISAAPGTINDSITSVYCDYNFPLFEYTVAFVGATGGQISLAPNPIYVPAPPAAINGPGGIQTGDLILITNSLGSAVGEVTNVNTTNIFFGDLDPLNVNQSGAANNNIKAISGGAKTVAYRLFAVTYYVTVPAAGSGQTPRLMRQVNAQTPTPVADDIINLQFAYDINSGGAIDSNQPNPLGVLESPNNIQKINIVVMGQSIINNSKAQNLYLATSVSARSMAFRDRYK